MMDVLFAVDYYHGMFSFSASEAGYISVVEQTSFSFPDAFCCTLSSRRCHAFFFLTSNGGVGRAFRRWKGQTAITTERQRFIDYRDVRGTQDLGLERYWALDISFGFCLFWDMYLDRYFRNYVICTLTFGNFLLVLGYVRNYFAADVKPPFRENTTCFLFLFF